MCRRILIILAAAIPLVSVAQGEPQEPDAQSPQAQSQALAQADALASRQDFKSALEAYQRADALSNHSCAECYLQMATMHRLLGDFPAALDDAQRAASLAGSNRMLAAQAHYTRASLLAETSDGPADPKLRDAESEFRAALALDPKKSIARFSLGMMFLAQGRDSEGIAEMRAYISGPFANPRYVDRAKRLIADPSRARMPTTDDFSFRTLEGETISNESLRGKVTLLDFWGTWCPPCRASVPLLANIHQKFQGPSFQMVGISSDDDEQTWRAFISDNHMNWQEYIDLDRKILAIFEIDSFPTFIVLDRNGVIQFRQSGVGAGSQAELEKVINKALVQSYFPAPAGTEKILAKAGEPASSASNANMGGASAIPSSPIAPASPPLYVPLRAGLVAAHTSTDAAESASPQKQFISPPEDVENGDADQGFYRNQFLGLSYRFPQSLTPATAEVLDQVNEMATRWIKEHSAVPEDATVHAGAAQESAISLPRIIFQASLNQRDAVPLVRITVEQMLRPQPLTVESLQREADNLKQRMGVAILTPPRQVASGQRNFFRTDFLRTQSDTPTWQSQIQALIAGRYRVTLEILARSQAELDTLATSAQSLTISKQ